MMYEATKVDGVWELTPPKLRGVFWVQGAFGQELMVMQYGRWFQDQEILAMPRAPMTWAWPDGSTDEGQQRGRRA